MAIATISIAADAAKGGTTQAPVYMSETAPAVAADGSLWFKTSTCRLYVYYVDGSSGQWVEV